MKNYIIIIIIIGLFIGLVSCGGGSKVSEEPISTPPSVPGLIYPESNMLCINNVVTFNWKASVDPEGDAVKYEIQVSDNRSFSEILHTEVLSGVSKTYSLDRGLVYYWRVKAIDATNASSNFTNVYQFYTEGKGVVNYIPFLPSLVSPNLTDVISTQTVTLEWLASDVDVNDTLVYDIYFGSDPSPAIIEVNHPSKSYSVPVLPSKTYFWRIVVKDNAGGKSIGKTWLFKTD